MSVSGRWRTDRKTDTQCEEGEIARVEGEGRGEAVNREEGSVSALYAEEASEKVRELAVEAAETYFSHSINAEEKMAKAGRRARWDRRCI